MSHVTWSQLDTLLSITASVLTIVAYIVGFFNGKRRGIELQQEQNQNSGNGGQYQRQSMKS